MYLRFYNLGKPPFGITPDPDFLFLSPSHKEALACLQYGIEARKGFIAITGEVGCGKTTVLRALRDRIDTKRVKIVYLFNPELSFAALAQTMLKELSLPVPEDDVSSAIRRLHLYLIEAFRREERVVLIIDEAHRMPVNTLERLCTLSNLETTAHKLLQIVLCGQPELDELLAKPNLRQLRERIVLRAAIKHLSGEESRAYIAHRLACAAAQGTPVLSPRALSKIVRHARGNPRTLNIVCDNTLIAGYAGQKRPIPLKTANEAIAGLRPWKHKRWLSPVPIGAVILTACVLALFLGAGNRYRPSNRSGLSTEPPHAQSLVDEGGGPFEVFAEGAGAPEYSPPDSSRVTGRRERIGDIHLPGSDPGRIAAWPTENTAGGLDTVANGPPATWIIEPGHTLFRLCKRHYGRVNQDIIDRILACNPQISHPDTILVGDTIVIPEISSGAPSQSDSDRPRFSRLKDTGGPDGQDI